MTDIDEFAEKVANLVEHSGLKVRDICTVLSTCWFHTMFHAAMGTLIEEEFDDEQDRH